MPPAPPPPLPALRLDESVGEADLLVPPVTWTPEFEEYRQTTAAVLASQANRGAGWILGLFVGLPFVLLSTLLLLPVIVPGRRAAAVLNFARAMQIFIPVGGILMVSFTYALISRRLGRRGVLVYFIGILVLVAAAQVAVGAATGGVVAGLSSSAFAWIIFLLLWAVWFRQAWNGGVIRKVWTGEPTYREERTVMLRPEGVQTDMALHSGLVRWPAVLKVSETKLCLLLHTGAYGFVSVPKRAFPDRAAYDRFAQVARERAGKRTAFEVLAKPQAAPPPPPPIPPVANPAGVRYAAPEP